MALLMATAAGEQHGLINTLPNSVPFDDFKSMSPSNKEKMIKEKKEDSRLVKGQYLNSRGRHERLTKPYTRYAGDSIQIWHLIPNQIYELPVGFINEVNSSKGLPKRSGLQEINGENVNKDGTPLEKDGEGEWIHKIIPVGF